MTIKELIESGQTEEAIRVLVDRNHKDSVLLQSRFNGAQRQYNMGMVDVSEWERTQGQINFQILEIDAAQPKQESAIDLIPGKTDREKYEAMTEILKIVDWAIVVSGNMAKNESFTALEKEAFHVCCDNFKSVLATGKRLSE